MDADFEILLHIFLDQLTGCPCPPWGTSKSFLVKPEHVDGTSQAKAWVGWEMSVGFGLSTNLQRWNGHQWDAAGSQPIKPPSPASVPVNGAEPAAQPSSSSPPPAASVTRTSGQVSPSSDSGSHSGSSSSPAAGTISTSVAQAMLECHYSFNNAFLEDEPLLEVSLDCSHTFFTPALACPLNV